jgi:hypothetical protein
MSLQPHPVRTITSADCLKCALNKLGHIGSVSFITHPIRKKKRDEKEFASKMNEVIESIHKARALTLFSF